MKLSSQNGRNVCNYMIQVVKLVVFILKALFDDRPQTLLLLFLKTLEIIVLK